VLEERVGGTAQVQYAWSPIYVDALILRHRDTNADGTLDEIMWVQQDANWNVTAITNSGGTVQERYAYEPYGQVTFWDANFTTRASSSYAQNVLYQGLIVDVGLNLANGRNRVYFIPLAGAAG